MGRAVNKYFLAVLDKWRALNKYFLAVVNKWGKINDL